MKKLKTIISVIVLISLLVVPSLAQGIKIEQRKWTMKTVTDLFQSIVNWLGIIAGGFAVIFIVVAGIRYILASGNPEAAQAAKGSIINAVIGIAIVAAAYGILTLIISLIPK